MVTDGRFVLLQPTSPREYSPISELRTALRTILSRKSRSPGMYCSSCSSQTTSRHHIKAYLALCPTRSISTSHPQSRLLWPHLLLLFRSQYLRLHLMIRLPVPRARRNRSATHYARPWPPIDETAQLSFAPWRGLTRHSRRSRMTGRSKSGWKANPKHCQRKNGAMSSKWYTSKPTRGSWGLIRTI